MYRAPGALRCVVCEQEIVGVEDLVVGVSGPFHGACMLTDTTLSSVNGRMADGRALLGIISKATALCVPCIGGELGLEPADVESSLLDLQRHTFVKEVAGTCVRCHLPAQLFTTR